MLSKGNCYFRIVVEGNLISSQIKLFSIRIAVRIYENVYSIVPLYCVVLPSHISLIYNLFQNISKCFFVNVQSST